MANLNNEQSLTYEQLMQMGVPLGQVADQQTQNQQSTQDDDWTVGGEVAAVGKTALPAIAAGLQSAEASVMDFMGLENSSNYSRRKAEATNKYVEENAPKTMIGNLALGAAQALPQVAGAVVAPEAAIPMALADMFGQAANQQTLAGEDYDTLKNIAVAGGTTALGAGLTRLVPTAGIGKTMLARKSAQMAEDAGQNIIANMGMNVAGGRDITEGNLTAGLEGIVGGQGLRGLDSMVGIPWNERATQAAAKASEIKGKNPNISDDHLQEFVTHQKVTDPYYKDLDAMDDTQFETASQVKQKTADNSTGAYADAASDDVLSSVGFKPTALTMDAPYADSLSGYSEGKASRLGDLHGVSRKQSVAAREILDRAKPLTEGQKANESVKTAEKRKKEVQEAGVAFQGKMRGSLVGDNIAKTRSKAMELDSAINELRQSGGDSTEISALNRQKTALHDLQTRLTSYGKALDNLGSRRPTISLDEVKQLGAEIDNFARKAGVSGELVGPNGKPGTFDPVASAHAYKLGTDKISAEFPQWRDATPEPSSEAKAVNISEGEQVAMLFSGGLSVPLTAGRAGMQAFKARRARKKLAKQLETQALARDARVNRFNESLKANDGASAAQAAEASLPDMGINVPEPKEPTAWNPPSEPTEVQKNTAEVAKDVVEAEVKDEAKVVEEAVKEAEKAPEQAPKRESKPVGPKPKQKSKEPEKAPEKPSIKVRPMDSDVVKRQEETKRKAAEAKAKTEVVSETEQGDKSGKVKMRPMDAEVTRRQAEKEAESKKAKETEEKSKEEEASKKAEEEKVERKKATEEDVKGRAKRVEKPVKEEEPAPQPEPTPEVEETPKPKSKPLPMEPKNLKKEVKGHPLTPTEMAFNRALKEEHKVRMNKIAEDLNTDADTINRAYSELYDAKGKSPTDSQIKERIKEDRTKAQKAQEAQAKKQAQEILDEETSDKERQAREAELAEQRAETQSRNERVEAAKSDVQAFVDAHDLPQEAVNEALKESGQMPGDFREKETGEPIDTVALQRKIVTIAKRMAREEKTAKNKALTKATQAINKARTESNRRKRIQAQEDKVQAAKDLFQAQKDDAVNYVSQMHPAVKQAAKKHVDSLFNKRTKLSESQENKLYRDLDKLEADNVGKLADQLQSRIDSEMKVLDSFINAAKPTPQDTIMKQKKAIDSLIDEKSELESKVGILNKQVEGFDAKVNKAVKEAVDAAEKERKLEAEEQKLQNNYSALEAQGKTVTEQIRKDVEGLENISEQDIQDFVEKEFKGKATPYTDLNALYKRADRHFEKLNKVIDSKTDVTTKAKRKIAKNTDEQNETLATEINNLMKTAIDRGENEEVTRLNKLVKAIQEQTGTKQTNAELALSNAITEANNRKQRYPNDESRWLTREMFDSFSKVMAGGVDTGSSYQGNLGKRLRSAVLDNPDQYAKAEWRYSADDAKVDDRVAKKQKASSSLVSIRRNKAKQRRLKNKKVEFVG